LKQHEDNVPIGEALFIIVDPSQDTLDATTGTLASCFPRAFGIGVQSGFAEWVEVGMPELVGRILKF
jgi:hypothetical protein